MVREECFNHYHIMQNHIRNHPHKTIMPSPLRALEWLVRTRSESHGLSPGGFTLSGAYLTPGGGGTPILEHGGELPLY